MRIGRISRYGAFEVNNLVLECSASASADANIWAASPMKTATKKVGGLHIADLQSQKHLKTYWTPTPLLKYNSLAILF